MVQEIEKKEKKFLPPPLKDLDQIGRDTAEVLGYEKGLIVSLGHGAKYYLDFYLKSLKKYEINFDVVEILQGPKELSGYREVDEPSKPINPFGCTKAIIFDNSTRSFRSLAGAYKYVLPHCAEWGIYEVYDFIMADENSGSNSTAIPIYQQYKIPYKGPLRVFHEKSLNIFNELDNLEYGKTNKKLTELISTWASSIHQPGKLKKMIEETKIEFKRILFNIRHRPPKPEPN